MVELRDRKCSEHYGADVWALASGEKRACYNFLCGNHTRNLPIVRYNKVHRLRTLFLNLTLNLCWCVVDVLVGCCCLGLLLLLSPCLVGNTCQVYDQWLHGELGEAIRVAKAACGMCCLLFFNLLSVLTCSCYFIFIGGQARLDGSGLLFLRSLCKLTHVGHAQYYKGDGHALFPGEGIPRPNQ